MPEIVHSMWEGGTLGCCARGPLFFICRWCMARCAQDRAENKQARPDNQRGAKAIPPEETNRSCALRNGWTESRPCEGVRDMRGICAGYARDTRLSDGVGRGI